MESINISGGLIESTNVLCELMKPSKLLWDLIESNDNPESTYSIYAYKDNTGDDHDVYLYQIENKVYSDCENINDAHFIEELRKAPEDIQFQFLLFGRIEKDLFLKKD